MILFPAADDADGLCGTRCAVGRSATRLDDAGRAGGGGAPFAVGATSISSRTTSGGSDENRTCLDVRRRVDPSSKRS